MRVIGRSNRIHIYNKQKKINVIRRQILLGIPLLLLIIMLVNNHLIFGVRITEDCMEPTLDKNSRYLFNKIHFGLQKPFSMNTPDNRYNKFENLKRGDIIALHSPLNDTPSLAARIFDLPLTILSLGIININPRELIIRRVIALPGENIEIRNKQIYINHKLFTPSWQIKYSDARIVPGRISSRDNLPVTFIPGGRCFLMSDNWDIHNDSRTFGTVPLYKIEGLLID